MRRSWPLAISAMFVLLPIAYAADPGAVAAASLTPSQCRDLRRVDLSQVPDAPAQVTSSEPIAAAKAAPAHCQVQGYIRSTIRFELRLPLAGWNNKFLMRGCGGFCGSLYSRSCDEPLLRGYACIVSDMGHASTALDAKWAYNDREAELDFAHRATHATTVAGKALTAAFYGRDASKSYFHGCSTGGRQGLVSAQRFPGDYDGIIAGAPVINETGAGMQLLWSVLAARTPDGGQVFTPAAVATLHAGALQACDARDGVRDGIIDDPRECGFDPATLQCAAGSAADCLTPAQVEAARRIYRGPVNSNGRSLYTGGAKPGSEMNWLGNYIADATRPASYYDFIGDLFRYLAFAEDPGPLWKPEQFDWDRDPDRVGFMEHLFTGSNPDLRAFKARAGKLLVYQGWADQSVVPGNIVDYYEAATRTMGGADATSAFFRLFMVPGMNHCAGGAGVSEFDYLAALEGWVERDTAPDRLLGVRREQGSVVLERAVLPYPGRLRYDGVGDPRQATSFREADVEVERLVSWWTGTFTGVDGGGEARRFEYRTIEVAGAAGPTLHVAQYSGAGTAPYRQRIYEFLREPGSGALITRIHAFESELTELSALPAGCEIRWQPRGDVFLGLQRKGDCRLPWPGESDGVLIADEITLTATTLATDARGSSAQGGAVFGDARPLLMNKSESNLAH